MPPGGRREARRPRGWSFGKKMKPRKYKALNGAVQSFAEGFTGIISSGFSELGRYAMATQQPHYRFNMLTRTSEPDISQQEWYSWLIDYIEPVQWMTAIGCAIDYVSTFTIEIDFVFADIHDNDYEYGLGFESSTVIEDDRGKRYVHKGAGFAWISK